MFINEMSNQDILSIDTKIKTMFQEDINNLPEYKKKLEHLNTLRNVEYISDKIKDDLYLTILNISDKIKNIESEERKNFYILESASLIKEYEKILITPIEESFMGKKSKGNKRKKTIITQFLDIAGKYITISNDKKAKIKKITCNNCKNKESFDIIDATIYICLDCGSHQMIHIPTSSYKDVDRINIGGKYKYARKVHFRDCMNQYQGKQNCTIAKDVYSKLSNEFDKHHLLVEDAKTEYEKYSKIEKSHILMFLKELNLTKHYENVNLIHYVFTGKKPDDISHLEDILITDFEILSDLYDKTFKHGETTINRKSFISTQYVLFQLLRRHKHGCDVNDFTILKTTDRKTFHDDVCMTLFGILGWNMILSY